MQFQIYSESKAADQATQWGNWEWSLENEEEEALGDGFMYLWLPNKCLCSSGLSLILLSMSLLGKKSSKLSELLFNAFYANLIWICSLNGLGSTLLNPWL